MRTKQNAKVGDRVIFNGQNKTCGVAVEINVNNGDGKDIKVHWKVAPKGNNIHRNGRGTYNIKQLKLVRI